MAEPPSDAPPTRGAPGGTFQFRQKLMQLLPGVPQGMFQFRQKRMQLLPRTSAILKGSLAVVPGVLAGKVQGTSTFIGATKCSAGTRTHAYARVRTRSVHAYHYPL